MWNWKGKQTSLQATAVNLIEKVQKLRKSANQHYDWAQSSLCRSIVKYPVRHCLFQWFILFAITSIVFAGGYFDFKNFGINDFIILGEQDAQNYLALTGAIDEAEDANKDLDIATQFRSEAIFFLSYRFLYDTSYGPLFTPETVKEICQVEELVVAQPRFPEYCLTDIPQGRETICSAEGQYLSLSFYFYAGEPPGCQKTLTENDITTILNGIDPGIKRFLLNDIDNPTIARSLISIAGPLGDDSAPYKNFTEIFTEFEEEQVEDGYVLLIRDFIDSIFDYFGVEEKLLSGGFFTDYFQLPGSSLRVQTGSDLLEFIVFLDYIDTDQVLSGGSYLIVLIFMSIYMRGVFLPVISMFSILLTIPVGLFIFAIIFQIDYWTPMNILIIFLIAGVGADNVFVLFDAWRQSEREIKDLSRDETQNKYLVGLTEYQKTLYLRLNYSYGRAALSVSHTAMTTFIAFLATVSSPITVIAAVGLYGAIVILVNLWYMFTVHPTNLMFYHYLLVMRCGRKIPTTDSGDKKDTVKEEKQDQQNKLRIIEKGFEKYIALVNNTYFPYFSISCIAILWTVMLSSTIRLETPSNLESNFPEGHMFDDFAVDFNNLFTTGTAESFTEVSGVFGISDLDVADVGRFSRGEVIGEPVYDPNFEIFSEESQNFILDICDELVTLPCYESGCTEDFLVLNGTVECIFKSFKEYLVLASPELNLTFVEPRRVGAFQTNEQFIEAMKDFLESPLGSQYSRAIGIFGNEVRFVVLTYRMTLIQYQPLKIKEPVIKLFDDYTRVVRAKAPVQLKSFFQNSIDHVWQHTETAFVTGLFTGLAISLSASFVVLLIGTRNPRVALFAILGVGGVVCSVLGTVRYIGYELGTAESIAGVFVIGLAVDYIVHLGHMFMHSRHYLPGEINFKQGKKGIKHMLFGQTGTMRFDNADMIAFSVRKMGTTVLAGAITTFAAAAFLSLCTFVFFRKMSVLLMLTIFYSISFAFLYFIPVLRVFGPGSK